MSAASCIGSELMHLLPRTPTAEGRAQRTAAENMFRKLIVEYRDEMINVSSMCVMSAAVLLWGAATCGWGILITLPDGEPKQHW